MAPLLDIQDIHTFYDNLEALHGVSLQVAEGEITTLIGAHGAGKTTTLRTACNVMRPRRGTVRYAGQDIAAWPVHELVGIDMVMVPEGRGIFAKLTVHENLQMGAFLRDDKREVAQDYDTVWELFPRLRERMTQHAGTLSGGEQQMLAIARGLMARPRLLLLDEPSMGLAPVLVDQIFATLTDINARGTTILLVEQNARRALQVSHRAYVLESGDVVLQGNSADLLRDPQVTEAYLGG